MKVIMVSATDALEPTDFDVDSIGEAGKFCAILVSDDVEEVRALSAHMFGGPVRVVAVEPEKP